MYIEVSTKEKRENGAQGIFERIMLENFHKLTKISQTLETQENPSRINTRKTILRHVIVKILKIKIKENILSTAREKGFIISLMIQ